MQLIGMQMEFADFKDTIDYAKDYLNLRDKIVPVKQEQNAKKSRHKESINMKSYAEKLAKNSLPVEGSIAEKYLKEIRGITDFKEADLRYIPSISTWHKHTKKTVPALLCIAKNKEGKVNHVQVIRLDPDTELQDKNSNITKQTYGAVSGIGIELNKKSTSHTTFLTEGVETGLSIIEAEKTARVLALLSKSNFAHVNLDQLGTHVILCLDNDGENTFKDNTIINAVDRLTQAGKSVLFIIPEKESADANDILITEGISGVKKLISQMISGNELLKNSEAFRPFSGHNLDALRQNLSQTKEKFDRNESSHSPITAPPLRQKVTQKELVLER